MSDSVKTDVRREVAGMRVERFGLPYYREQKVAARASAPDGFFVSGLGRPQELHRQRQPLRSKSAHFLACWDNAAREVSAVPNPP